MPAPPDAAGARPASHAADESAGRRPDEGAPQSSAAHGLDECAKPDHFARTGDDYGEGSISVPQAGANGAAERGAAPSTVPDAAGHTMAADAVSTAPLGEGGTAKRDVASSAASDAPNGETVADAAFATLSDEGDAAERGPTPSATLEPATDTTAADAASAPPPGEGDTPETPPDPALFAHALRIAEALVFASDRPVTPARLGGALPPGCDARAVLTALSAACAGRAVELVEVAGGFSFRTAPELAPAITRVVEAPRRLPRAAMETLAIVAYHQPVTRAEIEEIRGASLSQSTLELLLDAALVAPRGRKEVPGRPSLWGTTPRFLEQFGLKALGDLPRREELVNEPTLPLSAPSSPDATPPPSA